MVIVSSSLTALAYFLGFSGCWQLSAKYKYLLNELAINVFTQVDCRVMRPYLNNTHQKNKRERVLPAL